VFGCNLIAAFSSLKRDFFGNFTTSQKVIVVFRAPAASVAALDGFGLTLRLTLNDGAVAAPYRYEEGDSGSYEVQSRVGFGKFPMY
jgi:hypothetical protein